MIIAMILTITAVLLDLVWMHVNHAYTLHATLAILLTYSIERSSISSVIFASSATLVLSSCAYQSFLPGLGTLTLALGITQILYGQMHVTYWLLAPLITGILIIREYIILPLTISYTPTLVFTNRIIFATLIVATMIWLLTHTGKQDNRSST